MFRFNSKTIKPHPCVSVCLIHWRRSHQGSKVTGCDPFCFIFFTSSTSCKKEIRFRKMRLFFSFYFRLFRNHMWLVWCHFELKFPLKNVDFYSFFGRFIMLMSQLQLPFDTGLRMNVMVVCLFLSVCFCLFVLNPELFRLFLSGFFLQFCFSVFLFF